MKDTEIYNLIDKKDRDRSETCILHGGILSEINKKLARIETNQARFYKDSQKQEKQIDTNTDEILIINTRAKTKAGIYAVFITISLGVGTLLIFIIDKLIAMMNKS